MLWAADAAAGPGSIEFAKYSGVRFSIATEETVPYEIRFKPDGTKFYVSGTQVGKVHQYDLSVAWDITTATHATSYDVSGHSVAAPEGLAFSADGTKMYLSSSAGVYQYTLSTAWALSSASYSGTSNTGILTQAASPTSLEFKADGTKLYVASRGGDEKVYQYTLSTAWDISSATYDSKVLDCGVHPDVGYCWGVTLSDDGTTAYISDNFFSRVHRYTLSTPWDISTGTHDEVYFGASRTTVCEMNGIAISDDGTKAIVLDSYSGAVVQFELPASDQYAQYLYVMGSATGSVLQYGLSTAWDIGTAVETCKTLSVSTQESSPQGLELSADGTKLYVVGTATDTVYQYTLTTAWDVSSGSYASKSCSVNGSDTAPRGLFFKPDGTSFWIAGGTNTTVYQYDCSVAWDVSTGSAAGVSKSVSAQGTTLHDVFFKSDGTKFFTVRSGTTDAVYQYSMSTAWDVSSASYDSKSMAVGSQDSAPQGLAIRDDGTAAYIVGTTNDAAFQYSLGTAWDASTGSYASKKIEQVSDSGPTALRLNSV